jgi:hypothetical protein
MSGKNTHTFGHVIEIADARLKLARLKARGEEKWSRKIF